MKAQKKTQTENVISRLEALMNKFDGFDNEIISGCIKHLKERKDLVKRKSPDNFSKMALDRSAMKFHNWSNEQFEDYVKKLAAVFKHSKEMTNEDFERIEQINRKAVDARLKKLKEA